MRTTVRFWRWRRNPLKRRTDRAEAWVVLVAGVLLCLAGPAAGTAAGLATVAHAPRPGADWHRRTAVVLQDAPTVPAGDWTAVRSGGDQVRALVRWTPPAGPSRTGDALVAPGTPAGQHVRIWVDGHGALRDDPSDPSQTQARAVAFGLLAATMLCLMVLGVQYLVVALMRRRRAAALEREWAQVGPTWGHHPA